MGFLLATLAHRILHFSTCEKIHKWSNSTKKGMPRNSQTKSFFTTYYVTIYYYCILFIIFFPVFIVKYKFWLADPVTSINLNFIWMTCKAIMEVTASLWSNQIILLYSENLTSDVWGSVVVFLQSVECFLYWHFSWLLVLQEQKKSFAVGMSDDWLASLLSHRLPQTSSPQSYWG